MAQYTDFQALLAAMNTETDRLAAKLEELSGKVGTDMTADEEDQLQADFQGVINRLRGIGADPQNPIPAVK